MVGNASTTGGFVAVTFLQILVEERGFGYDDGGVLHTAFSLRHGRHAAPLFNGRLDRDGDDEVDMSDTCCGRACVDCVLAVTEPGPHLIYQGTRRVHLKA